MPGHGRGYACSRASISRLGSDNGTMWNGRTDVRRADTSVCPYMTSVYVYFPMCQHDVGADRRVRPVWDGGHTDAETRMQTDGGAVQQTLTAVWRRRRHLRECGKRGNDLKRSNGWQERALTRFDRLSGSSSFGVGAAGVASRHAAVSYCGRCCKTPR